MKRTWLVSVGVLLLASCGKVDKSEEENLFTHIENEVTAPDIESKENANESILVEEPLEIDKKESEKRKKEKSTTKMNDDQGSPVSDAIQTDDELYKEEFVE